MSASKLLPGQRIFDGPRLLQIAMPMGGIGAGCICLTGNGALADCSIHHQPATSAVADGAHLREAAFGILHVKATKPITLLLEGPMPREKIYDQGLRSQGIRLGGYEGLPRMSENRFVSGYPLGVVELADVRVPLQVSITGWSPFIPLDDRNSSIPCAILEYRFENTSNQPVEFEFSYHLSHLAVGHGGAKGTRNSRIEGFGVSFTNTDAPHREKFGSAALGMIARQPCAKPKIKAMWFRGGWFDSISALWREVSAGAMMENDGNASADIDGGNGGSVLTACRLGPGQSATIPILIAWHFPNVHLSAGRKDLPPQASKSLQIAPEEMQPPLWRPYYAGQWADAAAVARYVEENYQSLRSRTLAFRDALFGSTAPAELIDAVASNLAILKSPTVLRQENGNLWAWEGCTAEAGCCHGSCTHVWNYAQAIPHLFPQLERTFREAELLRSIDDRGHVQFRSALPDSDCCGHDFHAAADGQLGGILKLYRDWQISGDRAFLEKLYPAARRSLEYCIASWDPDRRGALFEPHHNTYDIEFWGPDGMCGSIYIAALCAMAAIERELGQDQSAQEYEALAAKGAKFLDEHLFNGDYYQQNVQWQGLRDQSFAKLIAEDDSPNSQMLELLKKEGPKYQYSSGCLSDGVIGAWMAKIYGVKTPMTAANIRRHLESIFRHNFKPDLWEHACTQRPGYAMGHEAGLLLCTWPRGGKPTLPFVYSDEVWTGIEYQAASHLIEEGLVSEGLRLVQAVRSRYDGHVRNPFNEYECGSYYARALASFAVLNSLSGFRYSAATRTLTLAPKLEIPAAGSGGESRYFFSAASGFGVIHLDSTFVSLEMIEGKLAIEMLDLTLAAKQRLIPWLATAEAGKQIARIEIPA